jgi:hypothetical protein
VGPPESLATRRAFLFLECLFGHILPQKAVEIRVAAGRAIRYKAHFKSRFSPFFASASWVAHAKKASIVFFSARLSAAVPCVK